MTHDDYTRALCAPEFAMLLWTAAMMGCGPAAFMYWAFLKGAR